MEFALDQMDTKTRSEEGVEVAIRRLDADEPLLDRNGHPVKIRVLGPDSGLYRKLTREQVRKRISRAASKEQPAQIDDEADALEILTACTLGWSGILDRQGNPVPFSREGAQRLYAAFPAIRDQVDVFIANRANFLKASSAA